MTNTQTTAIRPTCERCGFQSPGGSLQDHVDDGWMLRDDLGHADLCDECHLDATAPRFSDER